MDSLDEVERGIVITSDNENIELLKSLKSLIEERLSQVIVEVRVPSNTMYLALPPHLSAGIEIMQVCSTKNLNRISDIESIGLLAKKINEKSAWQHKKIMELGLNQELESLDGFRVRKYSRPNQPYMPFKSHTKKSKKSRRGSFNAK